MNIGEALGLPVGSIVYASRKSGSAICIEKYAVTPRADVSADARMRRSSNGNTPSQNVLYRFAPLTLQISEQGLELGYSHPSFMDDGQAKIILGVDLGAYIGSALKTYGIRNKEISEKIRVFIKS